MAALLIASYEGADINLKWVEEKPETVTHEKIQMMCTREGGQLRQHENGGALLFDTKLFLILSDGCRGALYRMTE